MVTCNAERTLFILDLTWTPSGRLVNWSGSKYVCFSELTLNGNSVFSAWQKHNNNAFNSSPSPEFQVIFLFTVV